MILEKLLVYKSDASVIFWVKYYELIVKGFPWIPQKLRLLPRFLATLHKAMVKSMLLKTTLIYLTEHGEITENNTYVYLIDHEEVELEPT